MQCRLGNPVSWSVAGLLLAVSFSLAASYPSWPTALVLLIAGLLALQWRWPNIWLMTLPAMLPLLDLAPWSGRVFLEDYDLLVLAVVALAIGQGRYTLMPLRHRPGLILILGFSLLSWSISLIVPLWPLPPLDANSFSSYLSPYNALRHVKPFMLLLLVLPALVHAFDRAPEEAGRWLIWGLSVGGAIIGVSALWERGVLEAFATGAGRYAVLGNLLDFTSPYRITGFFHDMHTGGEAVDAFLALTWPGALWLLFTSRTRGAQSLAAVMFALALYGVMSTFSRGSYAAFAAGLVSMAALSWKLRVSQRHSVAVKPLPGRARIQLMLGALILLGGMAYAFRSGGIVVLLACFISFAAVLLLSVRWANLGRYRLMAGIALFWIVGVTLGMHGLLTSKWVAHDAAESLLTAVLLVSIHVGTALWAGHGVARLVPWRSLIAGLAGMLVIAIIAMPAMMGYRMSERSATIGSDAQMRAGHWYTALGLMRPHPWAWFVGMGAGTFPDAYRWRYGVGSVGVPVINQDHDNAFLTLTSSQSYGFVLAQRVHLDPGQRYDARIKVRAAATTSRLEVRVCRRHILQYQDADWGCVEGRVFDGAQPGIWQEHHWQIALPPARAPAWTQAPYSLELFNTGQGSVDFDEVQLWAIDGERQVNNSGFQSGLDHWLPYYDFDHLPWHIKNFWAHVYFEQGMLGVVIMACWWLYAMIQLWGHQRGRSYPGIALSGILGASLTIGFVGAILDVPRVAFLLLLLLSVSALAGGVRVRREHANTRQMAA